MKAPTSKRRRLDRENFDTQTEYEEALERRRSRRVGRDRRQEPENHEDHDDEA